MHCGYLRWNCLVLVQTVNFIFALSKKNKNKILQNRKAFCSFTNILYFVYQTYHYLQLIICRSFRSSSFPLVDNAYPEDLNHFIGHAVDIHLMTTDGYCGDFCIYRK